jgi:6-phosphogluconate dehydrogenase
VIVDAAGQKGTGKWTVIEALQEGVPFTLIGEAVFARALSASKEERVAASKQLKFEGSAFAGDRNALVDDLRRALYASKIISYAQGYQLLRAAARNVQVEPELRRHRARMARRLHHPLGIPRRHQEGVRS